MIQAVEIMAHICQRNNYAALVLLSVLQPHNSLTTFEMLLHAQAAINTLETASQRCL